MPTCLPLSPERGDAEWRRLEWAAGVPNRRSVGNRAAIGVPECAPRAGRWCPQTPAEWRASAAHASALLPAARATDRRIFAGPQRDRTFTRQAHRRVARAERARPVPLGCGCADQTARPIPAVIVING